MSSETSDASFLMASAYASTRVLVFLIFSSVSYLRASRERCMVAAASRRDSAAFTAVNLALATSTAASRFFLASSAMERIAKRSSFFISARASLEVRRRFSIWVAARLAMFEISEVIFMLRVTLVLVLRSTRCFSAAAMRSSPFLTASRREALSSFSLAFWMLERFSRPFLFLMALARTMPVSLSILDSNFLSFLVTTVWRAVRRLAKSSLASRRELEISMTASRVWVLSLPLVFIWERSLASMAEYRADVFLASMWEAWARFFFMVARTAFSSMV